VIVNAQALALEPAEADKPFIGWHNLASAGAVAADGADADHPADNLANAATNLFWLSDSAIDQDLVVQFDAQEVDYLALFGHNFGSAAIAVELQDDSVSPPNILVQETLPADDTALILRFVPQVLAQLRLHLIQDGSPPAAPRAAVLYCGRSLVMPRGLWRGYSPIVFARRPQTVSNRSESGNFLGRIVLSETLESDAPFRLIAPADYRSDIDAFLAATRDHPFFFAWRPQSYPDEVAYCWLSEPPLPRHDEQSHLLEFDLRMQGLV